MYRASCNSLWAVHTHMHACETVSEGGPEILWLNGGGIGSLFSCPWADVWTVQCALSGSTSHVRHATWVNQVVVGWQASKHPWGVSVYWVLECCLFLPQEVEEKPILSSGSRAKIIHFVSISCKKLDGFISCRPMLGPGGSRALHLCEKWKKKQIQRTMTGSLGTQWNWSFTCAERKGVHP